MRTFTVGIIAALLWLGVVIAIYLLARNQPPQPKRTRRAWNNLRTRNEPPEPPAAEESPAGQPDPLKEPAVAFDLFTMRQDQASMSVETPNSHRAPDPRHSEEDESHSRMGIPESDQEMAEVHALIAAIDSPSGSHSPESKATGRNGKPPARTKAPAKPKPRKIGRMTYVVVDDEGRPQFD